MKINRYIFLSFRANFALRASCIYTDTEVKEMYEIIHFRVAFTVVAE